MPHCGDAATSVPPRPISLRAEILDGGLTPDGMRPTASVGNIKIRLGGGGDHRVQDGLWYAPALVAASRAASAAAGPAAGSSNWANCKTERRAEQRRTQSAQARADHQRRARFDASDDSDGGASATSAVRRSFQASHVAGAGSSAGTGGDSAADLC